MTERIETESAVGRYFDGEMTPEEARAFGAQLEGDAELGAELEALKISREMLVAHVEAQVEQADFNGFFERISGSLPQTTVVAEPAPTPAVTPAAAAPPSLAARLKSWWTKNWTPVLISAAAAAAVAFLVTRASTPTVDDGAGDTGEVVANGEVTVEEVNSDGPTTVLVSMPADDEDTTVIWLLDEDEEEAGANDPALEEEDPI